MRLLGAIFILIGFIGLYAWIGLVEPDCHYSTEIFLQIRMCGENFFPRDPRAGIWMPIVFGTMLFIGVVIRVRARSNTSDADEPANRHD